MQKTWFKCPHQLSLALLYYIESINNRAFVIGLEKLVQISVFHVFEHVPDIVD